MFKNLAGIHFTFFFKEGIHFGYQDGKLAFQFSLEKMSTILCTTP